MKLEEIEKRLQELPTIMEQLKAEQNQLLGYKQALLDIDKESNGKEEKKEKKD
tara:strand:- start:774 stop:932 length:159 start_codon:yes stop_codon:yes gene_type:complete